MIATILQVPKPAILTPEAWIAGLAAFAVTAVLFASVSHVVERAEIALQGRRTTGVVVQKLPREHQSLIYRYTVDAQEYEGTGVAGPSTGPFDGIFIGQAVELVYLPGSPQVSELADAVGEVKYTIGSVLGASILSGVAVGLRVATWTRARSRA